MDGIHLAPSFLKVALRAKGIDRAVLVTDAAAPAGCPPGRYQLGEQPVELTPDNRVMLVGQERLAGSALRMDHGVENLMRIAGLSLADAVRMSTVPQMLPRPARVPGRSGMSLDCRRTRRPDPIPLRLRGANRSRWKLLTCPW